MDEGWIKTHRKVRSHWLYQDKPFDRYHAWEDLLLSANHERKVFPHGNIMLSVERGQLVTSLRKLGERWGWSPEKVHRFLNLLVSDGMLEIECDTKKTVITIANYSFYQSEQKETRHQRDTSETQTNTNKNVKNYKNTMTTTTPAREADKTWGTILTHYETVMGTLPAPVISEGLRFYLESGMRETVIMATIDEAAEPEQQNWKYIKSILERRRKSGIVTMEDLARDRAAWNKRKEQGKSGRRAGGSLVSTEKDYSGGL